ncbi:capsule biosynthesis GfcC family protein [Pantoea alhagi]|uniref:capsule biosynthesis GfcC D2 domain-containing protein n=1 Tax=Pantoea alhagi TaxID=1891675 RepID=UPI00202B4844|nr:capsule biosynthesis GfcC D2 domain-containing protein [Pantoea alhagi]URQ60536.1 capsule biosynthesis GfcC family protein [Pantoea alhagi]
MKNILALASLLGGLAFNALADSQVTIYYPNASQTAVVSDAQTLSQLLASPAVKDRSWWPGTVIAESLATAAAQQHYQQTLARLQRWAASEEGERAAAINAVLQQLKTVRVTGRQFTSLDPDWIRLRPEANRRLEGEYSLYTLQRPTSITLAGAIGGSGKVVWQPGRDTRDYLVGHARLSGAERNVATVIAPDGATREVPVAYWNHRHVEVAPGSIIYLGFSSWALPDEYHDLNQQIISVLTHRIPD